MSIITHYRIEQSELRRKYGSTGGFDPGALCGNGNYHAVTTRDTCVVDCPACREMLADKPAYLDRAFREAEA